MDTANVRRLPEKGAAKVVELGGRNASLLANCIKGTDRRIDGHVRFSYNPSFSACFLVGTVFSLTTNQPEQYFGLSF